MFCSPAHHLLSPAALCCVVTCSLRSFSSDRSNTLNRSSFARDSMMIEEILAPTKDTVRSIPCLSHQLFLYSGLFCLFSARILNLCLYSASFHFFLTLHLYLSVWSVVCCYSSQLSPSCLLVRAPSLCQWFSEMTDIVDWKLGEE